MSAAARPRDLRRAACRHGRAWCVLVAWTLGWCCRPALAALPIEHWQLPGGARVYFVESRDLPMLDVSVQFPAGSSRDQPATSGLANLTLRALRAGARGMTEEDISSGLADVGAVLGATFDVDRAGYTLRVLSDMRQREPALAILARLLAQPAFEAAAVDREKARMIAGLREAELKPDQIAARALGALVYRDHPYALHGGGEVDSVQRLRRDDLVAFHSRFYLASHAIVALIGDVSRAQAEAIAQSLVAGLPPGGGVPPAPPALDPIPQPVVRFIAHPATQAHIVLGAPGMRRTDPDYFPLLVGNHVLGSSGSSSRLYQEVRERRGLSYSVSSAFTPYRESGAFTVRLQTRRDRAGEALEVVHATLAEFVAGGPSQAELDDAKRNLIGGFALRIDSNREILDYLALIGFYDLPLDYLEQFPQHVAAVSLEQVRDAFRRRLDPQRMATVVVGGEAADGPPVP
jgi:zinc protease